MDSEPVDLESAVRLGNGIATAERSQVLSVLESLEGRLRALDRSTLRIEAWVKNRGDRDQVVYLSVRSADIDLIAHDQSDDFGQSLTKARNDLRRQLTDAHDRRTRRHQ